LSALLKKLALLTATSATIGLGGAGAAQAATPGQLDGGARLNPGATLYSHNGSQTLTMQTNGNLVLYAPGHVAIWASRTAGHANSILIEQSDGNLVVVAPGNKPIWSSGTSGHPGTVLQVQNDGNAVQYAPGHVAIWSTKTGGASNSSRPPAQTAHKYPASFIPSAAATWAVNNALNPIRVPANYKQLFNGEREPCTTFVSWALAKGGMPEAADWFPFWDDPFTQHSVWLYMSSNNPVPAWYAANNFRARFIASGWTTERLIYPGSTPAAISIGDVIYYQWDGTSNHPHVAVVTRIENGTIKVTDQGGAKLYPESVNRNIYFGHSGSDLRKDKPKMRIYVMHWQ
jgi:hypothetical protein